MQKPVTKPQQKNDAQQNAPILNETEATPHNLPNTKKRKLVIKKKTTSATSAPLTAGAGEIRIDTSELEFQDVKVASSPLILYEAVDMPRLSRLIQHLSTQIKPLGPDVSAEDTANTRDALRRYQASIREGRRKVTYRPSTPQGIGRVFADRGLSLQNFCKRVRHTLAAGKFHDIDTVNAHPVILMALCRQLAPHISISNLEYYVENREELLAELVNKLSPLPD